MAINSFLSLEEALELIRKEGANPSLPFVILNSKGHIRFANTRMLKILNLELWKPGEEVDLKNFWPFFSEQDSREALLGKITKVQNSDFLRAEAQLKTYKLYIFRVKSSRLILVSAEMLRTGDLLEDESARQQFFHSMAHEIRTSVTGIKGYLEILEEGVPLQENKNILKRMKMLSHRLEKVVDRLADLKIYLDHGNKGSGT